MLENINIINSYMGIRHIGIYVKNLKLMKSFYSNVFYMKVICDNVFDCGNFIDVLHGKENTKMYISKLIMPRGEVSGKGDMIELIWIDEKRECYNEKTKLTDIGRIHIAFETENIQHTVRKIIEYGGKILAEPFCRENGNWLAFCCDPENNYLELIQRA